MPLKSAVILFISALLLAGPAFALGLSEETSVGSIIFEQTASVDGEFGGTKEHDPDWDWNLDYAFERSTTPSDNAPSVIDNTSTYSGGLGWDSQVGFNVDGSLTYSSTPEENLVSRGGTVSASYRWDYAKGAPVTTNSDTLNTDSKQAAGAAFPPTLTTRISGSSTTYTEAFSGTTVARRKGAAVKPVTGSSDIKQTSGSLAMIWRPSRRFRLALTYAHYSYDKDVAQFENNLDSPTGLQRGVSGFADTVGGLPDQSYQAKISYGLTEKLKLIISEQFATLAVDKSPSQTQLGELELSLGESWKITAGAEALRSSTLTDTLAILGLAVDF